MQFSLRHKNKPFRAVGFGISIRVLVLGLVVLCLAGIFYAYSSVRALNLSLQASQALSVQHELIETSRRLKMELSNLRSMERLEQQAVSMGLLRPAPHQFRRLP